jgi:hypothetical protein
VIYYWAKAVVSTTQDIERNIDEIEVMEGVAD